MENEDPPNKSVDTGQSDKPVQNTDIPLSNGARLPTIDDFVFIKPISRGAFGKVFLGHKKGNPDRLYAIKAMKKSDMINKNLTSQVQAERDAMANVLSPFIVQLFYSLQSQQNIFLIMEYLIGGDLKSLLAVAGYFDEPMAVMYVAEVTLALEYLHRKGIIHRDIKPDNMLMTNKGHIKLTDFGLSKINMNKFNNQEVPMTPKNMFYQPNFEYFRTPGQILSLKSSLAFSVERKPGYKEKGRQSTSQSPLMEISMNSVEPFMSPSNTPKLSQYKLMKQKSMRDMLLTHSITKNKQVPRATPDKNMSSPKIAPVSSLVSSLEASLNWTQSSESVKHDQSSINISDLSSIGHDPRAVGLSVSHLDSLNNGPRRSTIASDMSHDDPMEAIDHRDHTDGSDNVFEHCNHSINDSELHQSVELTDELEGFTDNNLMNDTGTCIKCTCRRRSTNLLKTECYECESHVKAPSRQEKLTDDTPQMHRTDKSVRNSYSAKNLEALRLGSYCSEESDSDINSKENTNDSSLSKGKETMPVPLRWKERSDSEPIRRHNPRRLVKTKSFSYPSDEESDGGGRYQGHVKFARKRSFYDVEQSPVRRSHSADTGLTQEFRLLRCNGLEPLTKRSNSLPRTRIRFNSGSETWKNESVKIKASTEADIKPELLVKQCNTRLLTSTRILSGPDSIAVLSAEENRSLEVQSDASGSDNVSEVSPSASQSKLSATIAKSSCHPKVPGADFVTLSSANSTNSLTNINYVAVSEIKDTDCVDNIPPGKPGFHGTNGIFPLKTKQLMDLKTPMVSSLRSEGDVQMESPNLSRIGCARTQQLPSPSANTDVSVFYNDGTSLSNIERPRSPSPPFRIRQRDSWGAKHVAGVSLPSQDTPLLPPPPPRTRRPSGKPTRVIQFSSVAACIPATVYNESHSWNSFGKSAIPMTPEPPHISKVKFCSPDFRFGQSPKTPLEKPFLSSQSFVSALKTPFRTPKSVRRAPPPPEEERILGTPDYLAPEVLQQKSHGPGVDWWSLGICMFEFLTGIPPFNDQTPELVFENILKRDIPWPEGEEELSAESRAAIDGLLTMEPDQRPGAKEVKKMAVFGNIDWDHLLNMEAPWVPQPDDSMDTSYFEARNLLQDLNVSDIDF